MVFSNRFSAILGKCDPNKIKLLVILIYIASCASQKPRNQSPIHSEIICPNGQKILIQHRRADETSEAIRRFYEIKRLQQTKENYTIIKYRDGSTTQIKQIPPEEMITCTIREIYWLNIDYNYDLIY